MKKATQKILNYFPNLENKIPNYDSMILEQQTLDELNSTEQVFLKMIWFFEEPNQNNFNLYDLLKYIDQDWLSLALECIYTFFSVDNYLMETPHFSVVTESSIYFNQTDFANFLNEHKQQHGRNYSRQMINTYSKRNIIPRPDLIIANSKFWLKETCEVYLKEISYDKRTQTNKKSDNTLFEHPSLNLLQELLNEYKKDKNKMSKVESVALSEAENLINEQKTKLEDYT